MAKPVVFVIGASGSIGAATVAALSTRYAKVEIRAGVRNPDDCKADKLKSLSNVTVVQATMGDNENLTSILKGVDTLYVNTPGTENRAQLVVATVEAAKAAGVKHLVVVSSVMARPSRDTVFGKHFSETEDKIEQLGVPYTFLRLPFFAENFLGTRRTIVGQGTITAAVNPDKPLAIVTVGDAGEAGAVILSDPSKHGGKTYNIISDSTTYNDIIRMFSQALGKEIKYNRMEYEALRKGMVGAGFQEWQATGLVQMSKLVDEGAPEVNPSDRSDYERITGRKPTSLNEWITTNAPGFQ